MIAILMAAAIAIVASITLTRLLIAYFARLGKGQPILGAEDRLHTALASLPYPNREI